MPPSSLIPRQQLTALLDRWARKARTLEEESIYSLVLGVISDVACEEVDHQRRLDDLNYLNFLRHMDDLDIEEEPWP